MTRRFSVLYSIEAAAERPSPIGCFSLGNGLWAIAVDSKPKAPYVLARWAAENRKSIVEWAEFKGAVELERLKAPRWRDFAGEAVGYSKVSGIFQIAGEPTTRNFCIIFGWCESNGQEAVHGGCWLVEVN